ncbi:MAG: hypothetical protein SCM11_18680 [Bacillota bacterium]|nr:hypothetical protein [Bacillota bacterium]
MIETYLKLFLALLAGFAITGAALIISRRLSILIDKKRSKNKLPTPDQPDENRQADDKKDTE